MITIKSPSTKDEFKAYYALRYKVLSEPWGHPKGTEKDDYEPISEHFMAVDDATGEVVGVIKFIEKAPGVGDLSHMAVAPKFQRKGIGTQLVKAVEQRAAEKGYHTIGAMARVTATSYFEKQGYRIAGIPAPHLGTTHSVWMEKKLKD